MGSYLVNESTVWSDKGYKHIQLNNYNYALECFDNAIQIDPINSQAWHNKGYALFKLGKYKEALECFDNATKIDPQYNYEWCNKGLVCDYQNRSKEAAVFYSIAQKKNMIKVLEWYSKVLNDNGTKCTLFSKPSSQENDATIDFVKHRLVGDVYSESRQPLAPYLLLGSTDQPLDFKTALITAYENLIDHSQIEPFIPYVEEIYEQTKDNGNNLTQCECMAVYFYTVEWPEPSLNTYSLLNKALVDSNRYNATKWKFYLYYLFNALYKIPKWQSSQDLYRGVNLDLVKEYPSKYGVGKKIT